jgi:dGTPase
VVRTSEKTERIITELFDAYRENPGILPARIQQQLGDDQLERKICDYIAGMTDRFAIEEHQKLFNPMVLP